MGKEDESKLQHTMCSQLWNMYIHRQHWKYIKISLVYDKVLFTFLSLYAFSSFYNGHMLFLLTSNIFFNSYL